MLPTAFKINARDSPVEISLLFRIVLAFFNSHSASFVPNHYRFLGFLVSEVEIEIEILYALTHAQIVGLFANFMVSVSTICVELEHEWVTVVSLLWLNAHCLLQLRAMVSLFLLIFIRA